MLRAAIALILGSGIAAPAFAQQIFKCTDASGRVEYRNSVCPSGTRRDAVAISNLSIIEAERRVDDARATRAPVSPQAPPGNPMLAPGSERGATNPARAEPPARQR